VHEVKVCSQFSPLSYPPSIAIYSQCLIMVPRPSNISGSKPSASNFNNFIDSIFFSAIKESSRTALTFTFSVHVLGFIKEESPVLVFAKKLSSLSTLASAKLYRFAPPRIKF
jgi:hypothetical protein